uniref:Peptidase A1 domain-containing protein n=1 Tax=Heterorhabditis bacteriophora TaxID=37862 RepID=A0A1I7XPI8_HETBA
MKLYQEGILEQYLKEKNDKLTNRSILLTANTPIIDFDDMAYMVEISLGTPGQQFVVFLDSGSANLWVPDQSCSQRNSTTCGTYCKETPYDTCLTFCQDACCSKETDLRAKTCLSKRRFNQNVSSTYVPQNASFDLIYQTGEVRGFLGKDTFCLSGTTLCVENQIFGQAKIMAEAFSRQPQDGIIGLGWPALAYNNINPPIFNFLDQKLLDKPYFVIYMKNLGPTSDNNGGQLTVGGLDTVNCESYYDPIPLTSKTFWQFKLTKVSVGSYNVSPRSGWQAVSNTAATFIGGPKSIIDKIALEVGAKPTMLEAYFIDCDSKPNDIVFTINGKDYHITAANYIISAGAGPCMFAFFPFTSGGFYPSWMLGPPLIREYCQIHNMANGTIGMAKSKSLV